ncbi:Hsp20/alpha crystallin family protein [Natronorubrum bangense]|uniref:Hsp20-type chaperone n=2 Tax=Natronorubrum bangense TaxID=61858 RepID=L9WFT5_9EURY|nr:Hsp20/alpha crystallin family protein [Natronorubrum bangense]ELY47168.1 hsp20-type chaperone [Natronorubrum bangense JCM 10635]QCC53398.1 Hsp20/alpha crystallin family protein [Natronorubrum bangense]
MSTDSNPFRNLEKQFERMQRQIEEALEMWDFDQFDQSQAAVTTMGVDLADHGETFVLTADVPGFEKDDIDVRLSENTIHITATREAETTDDPEDEFYIKSERARQSLSRSIRLPDPVDEDAVEARYRNGVLTITLPKHDPETREGQQIDIE